MTLFLASEMMLFGALIVGLALLRRLNGAAFAAMSERLNLWAGAANTLFLLTSSALVALAVLLARADARKGAAGAMAGAALLGLVFLAIKLFEYHSDYTEGLVPGFGLGEALAGGRRLFMSAYFMTTSLHALHVLAGIAVLSLGAIRLCRPVPPSPAFVENVALYWHLVDIVWVFLFPLLYLSR